MRKDTPIRTGGFAMSYLILAVSLFFLSASLVLFWLSRVVHPDLLDDAILSLGLSVTALGLAQVITHGLARGLPVLALLLAVR
jgi:hypothetical protein